MGELGGWDVAAQVTSLGRLCEKVPHHGLQVLFGMGGVLALVKESGEFTPVPLAGDARVRIEHRPETLERGAIPVADACQLVEMSGDLT